METFPQGIAHNDTSKQYMNMNINTYLNVGVKERHREKEIERILTSSSVSQSDVANAPVALPICSECGATKFRHSNTGC